MSPPEPLVMCRLGYLTRVASVGLVRCPIGAASVGYANEPGKSDDLTAAGPDAVITNTSELTEAIRARSRYAWAERQTGRRRVELR
ncbi:hypothetical protein [Streptomyces sp. SID13031]|uniref:hypothetical protein n=1 Tax=Streptomyces sp. SID13031 TaxID=2706046 RepID=UPI0013C71709|nr:hypothetical protein [Streptomyces sp. SID13031]NEA31972.1 hypothetical protein [Streptomyces sp. SID13031]